MRLIMLLTVATAFSGTALAQAQRAAPQTPQRVPDATTQSPPAAQAQSVDVGAIFDKLDVNHDGKLSPEEAQAHPTVASHFKDVDANGDGMITKEEFMAAFKPH
jgi:hypothetical protein